jgi:uncharacterized protein (DUF2141 family)
MILKKTVDFIWRQFLFLSAGIFFGILVFSRCANQGMPTGGPKDTIPPFLVESTPHPMAVNYSGKDIRLTFNEYIIPDEVSEELVISPPLDKRASVRTKSKTLIVEFNEPLKQDVTYSLDFKNSVVDNNERNPLIGLRVLFGTGPVIDTLRVAGTVKRADNLEPLEKTVVMLHSNLHDTAVYRSKPDYIARTDNRGIFLFDNIKAGTYQLFALNDANSNLKYDAGAEEFAFSDSLVMPSAGYIEIPDSMATGADSLLISGHTLFKPGPVVLRIFTEKVFEQYLDKAIRESRYKTTFVFGETVKDSFGISLPGYESRNWFLTEYNPDFDSLTVWITDTLIAARDTLPLEISYFQIDSLNRRFVTRDTVRLVYTEKEKTESRRKKKENELPEILQFQFSDNIQSDKFDLNNSILITSPEPVKQFDFSKIKLSLADDSTSVPIRIHVEKDSTAWRTYRISVNWETGTSYRLEIDSAACENIYGITNKKISKEFTTQKEDFYGRIILDLTSVENPLLVQLLKNTKEEEILKTLNTNQNGRVIFDFLHPSKYKVRIVFDENDNGKWDTGNYRSGLQPERVAYLPEIIKVRSNWDNQRLWDLKPDPRFVKSLIDREELELQQKKQKEQERQERESVTPAEGTDSQFRMPGF